MREEWKGWGAMVGGDDFTSKAEKGGGAGGGGAGGIGTLGLDV